MYDHINRFKDDERAFLREQLREFFGLDSGALPPGLDEEGLMGEYRRNLKERCGVPYVADLLIPVPTAKRTKFRLVVGGHHPEVLRLFRDTEARVCGREAGAILAGVKDRAQADRARTPLLFPTRAPEEDPGYAALRDAGLQKIRALMPKKLERDGPQRFGLLWPRVLQAYHVTHANLSALLREMHKAGELVIEGLGPRERSPKDNYVLALPGQFEAQ